MTIGILFVVASLQLVACVPINTTVAVSPMEEQTAQQEQQDIACLLRDNAGKRSTFYTAVRAKHGFQDTPGELYVIIMSYHQIEYVYPLLVNIIEQVVLSFFFL